MKSQKSKNQESFKDFIESSLSKKEVDNLYSKMGKSKKWVTMRLLSPKKLKGCELILLLEITGKSIEDFKPYLQ